MKRVGLAVIGLLAVKPWTVVKTFRRSPETQIMKYVCEENNRNPIRPDGSTGVVLK